jgi:hypothetical protein
MPVLVYMDRSIMRSLFVYLVRLNSCDYRALRSVHAGISFRHAAVAKVDSFTLQRASNRKVS